MDYIYGYPKYIEDFCKEFNRYEITSGPFIEYIEQQIGEIEKCIEQISQDNFWKSISIILGIDAKLCLVLELLEICDFSDEEMIRIISNDYKSYFKELSGYNLREKTKPSLFFNIL
ncbi:MULTISPECIES: DUF7006 family protein [unclassified Enterococcus]|uniref:DUF7006 family protein n=1 Tax=unclassified Enterococcus TaxID=2608891 RepID=UPI001A9C21C3|nr:hypothetical protein [Enterococcus sp. DIV1271a]MBO1301257.1 hypothetical protein [Enterococcus sp. DIV1271a]